jgi:pimeloyl-ACP methyl ester carboxylesterase
MGGSASQLPERYAKCDPIQLLPLGIPQLVVHGADDLTIPVQRSREYVAAARAAGDEAELIEPRPGGHRSHIDPRSTGWRAVVEWLSAQRSISRQAAR